MKVINIILILIFFSQLTIAQTFLWEGAVGGSDLDYPNSIWVGNDGSTYITGNYASNVIKNGNQILATNVTGSPMNFFLLKINSSGTPVFVRDAQYTSSAIGMEVRTDSSQNIYNLVINNSSFWITIDNDTFWSEYGGAGALLLKYDSSGNFLWGKPFSSGDSYDISAGMDIINDNNIISCSSDHDYVTDSVGNIVAFNNNLIICNFDSTGNIKWSRSIKNIPDFYRMQIDDHQNINILCKKKIDSVYVDSQFVTTDSLHFFLIRFNKDGDFIEYIPFQSNDVFDNITFTIDNNDNIYFAGDYVSQSFSAFNLPTQNKLTSNSRDIFIVKTNYHGIGKWINSIQSYSAKDIGDIATDYNGDLYLLGQQLMDTGIYYNNLYYPASPGYFNHLIKIDTLGNLLDYILSSRFADMFYSFIVTAPNEIFITSQGNKGAPLFSYSTGNSYGYNDICFGKFSYVTSIKNNSHTYNDIDIYPNPANEFIHFDINTDIRLQNIRIFDLYGKIVRVIDNINQYSNKVYISDLSNGIYFINLSTSKGCITKKFIKI